MVETHTRILGIAPYDGMRTAMEQAAQAYPNVELEVYTGDLEEGQAIVQSMTPNSYDCIISRGGTATLIRQVTDLPVVDIHISVYDVLRTMKLAENYTSLYAIVGFPSITEPAHTLCSLLNFDLDILTVRSAEEVRHTLERLKQGGYRMVVCDMVTHTIAREMGFDNINMDLIMGLPGEDLDDVKHTLEEIEALKPDSLTVHSLAIKRAARLNMFKEEYADLKINNTPEMIALSEACARRMGMEPYYLYRQKNMAGNFENVGYSLPGKACIYNILIMEEMQTIAACGAGTTTKVVFPSENRRERCENVKEVEQYISRIDEMIGRKEKIIH